MNAVQNVGAKAVPRGNQNRRPREYHSDDRPCPPGISGKECSTTAPTAPATFSGTTQEPLCNCGDCTPAPASGNRVPPFTISETADGTARVPTMNEIVNLTAILNPSGGEILTISGFTFWRKAVRRECSRSRACHLRVTSERKYPHRGIRSFRVQLNMHRLYHAAAQCSDGHQIQCRTPPGLGFDFKWFITVGGQTCGDGSGTCDDSGVCGDDKLSASEQMLWSQSSIRPALQNLCRICGTLQGAYFGTRNKHRLHRELPRQGHHSGGSPNNGRGALTKERLSLCCPRRIWPGYPSVSEGRSHRQTLVTKTARILDAPSLNAGFPRVVEDQAALIDAKCQPNSTRYVVTLTGDNLCNPSGGPGMWQGLFMRRRKQHGSVQRHRSGCAPGQLGTSCDQGLCLQ